MSCMASPKPMLPAVIEPPAHAMGVTSVLPSTAAEVAAQVRVSINDLADREGATERVMAFGKRAIGPLRCYLSEGAQVIPQGRLFAVSMLARLRSPEAREGLRDVLYDTSLRELPVAWQDAEYQVKDAVIRLLLAREYLGLAADVTYAVEKERLPSAVGVVGELGLSSLAPVLVAMLEDDVLEQAAGRSLQALGVQGQEAILCALSRLLEEAQTRARGRLSVIRALLLLHHLHSTLPLWAAHRVRNDLHPGVRAAGALLANSSNREIVTALVRGALSDYSRLASACRERLASGGAEFIAAALDALKRNGEPNIYGDQHCLRKDTIRWLVSETLTAARNDSRARRAVVAGMNPELLAMGLIAAHIPTVEFFGGSNAHRSLFKWTSMNDAKNTVGKHGSNHGQT